MTEKPTCDRCDSAEDVFLYWEDSDDWARGERPDSIGCDSCGVLVR